MNNTRVTQITKLSAAILILCGSAFASSGTRNGNWWIERTQPEKAMYITGFFDGMELGRNFSYWDLVGQKGMVKKVTDSYATFVRKYMTDVTNIQITDGLNVFYEDFRNRKIGIENGVWLVIQQIAGKPDEEMQTLIETYRCNAR